MPAAHPTEDDRNWIANARGRLALRRTEKPATKAGQIRALWPDIEAALAVGQSMKTICAWLAEDAGIKLGLTSLTSYVSRIRRRHAGKMCVARIEGPVQSPSESTAQRWDSHPASVSVAANLLPDVGLRTKPEGDPNSIRRRDPLANVHASEAKRPGFHYRVPTPEDEKKLI